MNVLVTEDGQQISPLFSFAYLCVPLREACGTLAITCTARNPFGFLVNAGARRDLHSALCSDLFRAYCNSQQCVEPLGRSLESASRADRQTPKNLGAEFA
jgi:hypothetical protein